jgi:hypothetical protein
LAPPRFCNRLLLSSALSPWRSVRGGCKSAISTGYTGVHSIFASSKCLRASTGAIFRTQQQNFVATKFDTCCAYFQLCITYTCQAARSLTRPTTTHYEGPVQVETTEKATRGLQAGSQSTAALPFKNSRRKWRSSVLSPQRCPQSPVHKVPQVKLVCLLGGAPLPATAGRRVARAQRSARSPCPQPQTPAPRPCGARAPRPTPHAQPQHDARRPLTGCGAVDPVRANQTRLPALGLLPLEFC